MKINIASFEPSFDCTLLARALAQEFSKSVEIAAPLKTRVDWFVLGKGWNAAAILKTTPNKHIGRTVLLFPGKLEFEGKKVHGLAEFAGSRCVVSIEGFEKNVGSKVTAFDHRLVKQSVHELGHCYGLKHCPKRNCAMNERSPSIELCASCKKKVY